MNEVVGCMVFTGQPVQGSQLVTQRNVVTGTFTHSVRKLVCGTRLQVCVAHGLQAEVPHEETPQGLQAEVPQGLQAEVAQGLKQAVVEQGLHGLPQNSGRYVVRPQPNQPSNRPHSAWLSAGVARSAATMPQQSVMPRAEREIMFILRK